MPETIHPQHSEASPQHSPGPEFGLTDRQKEALIERQAADLARLRGINADLRSTLEAAMKALDVLIAKAEGRDAE